MIRHLLKLAWHRKRANALVMLEIFASFLVLFVVTTLGAWFFYLYNLPTGFDRRDVWNVDVSRGGNGDERFTPADAALFTRLLSEARGLGAVRAAAAAYGVPYDGHNWTGSWDVNERLFETELDQVTEEFDKVLGIHLLAGRWFEAADEALAWRPAVLTVSAARDLFHTEDVLGKKLPVAKDEPETRVVGIIQDFRKAGELAPPDNFIFGRIRAGDPNSMPPESILLKVAPDADAGVEKAILDRFRAIAPAWSFGLRSLDEMRANRFQERLVPLLVGAIIGGFLLLMVALGLVGVLWQNVTTRTREIGLRRAAGASGAAVRRQILLEVFVNTTIGLFVATILLAQVPLLGLVPYLTPGVYAAGLVVSLGLMYLLTFLCGYYPSWMATRVQPAEALRTE